MRKGYKYKIGDIVSGVPHELTRKFAPETYLIIDFDTTRYLNHNLEIYIVLEMETGKYKKFGRKYIEHLKLVA